MSPQTTTPPALPPAEQDRCIQFGWLALALSVFDWRQVA
ncbi:hypothetical protein ISF6_4585 [Piscinibacter sakaiensis]|uniref:Uncharacterized protein n=1 Tax=Piscinibacter sakaiensis TaxID=1547922 RepID=A0A0K8NWU5_PISS1|nr:hypothetical protein ISF6_4585 [Piscinibacter sakaiensis]